ncbi:MAG: ATP synthase F1 subunit delta [Bacteroidota bacterium]
MKTGRIAIRYAKALFDLALEENVLESVHADMVALQNVCVANRDFRLLLQSPIISQDKKISVFKVLFAENFNFMSFRFLEIIIKKRREVAIDEIAQEFINMYKDKHNIKTVYLKTAVVPDENVIEHLKQMLVKQLHATIELVQTVVPNLVGGFILTVDDKQVDTSIRKNLNKLKKEYNINFYEPKF